MKTNKELLNEYLTGPIINKIGLVELFENLQKENQELKEFKDKHNDRFLPLLAKQWETVKGEYREQFLKVVASVLDNHRKIYDDEECELYCSCNLSKNIDNYDEHLLQEIRKAIENGK